MTRKAEKPQPWYFLFGVLFWSWFFFGLAATTGQGWLQFPTILLTSLGGFGPLIVAVILIKRGFWDAALDRSAAEFLRRCFNPRTLSLRWLLFILLFVVLLKAGPLLLEPSMIEQRGLFTPGPLLFFLVGFIIGALEEIGWRGYAQETLQRRMPIIYASLLIGLFWALWHLPLFFLDGSYQASLGFATPAFWSFNIALVIGSPLYAWFYNVTGRSVFAPLLFHGLYNVAGEIFADPTRVLELAVITLLVILLVIISRKWILKKRG